MGGITVSEMRPIMKDVCVDREEPPVLDWLPPEVDFDGPPPGQPPVISTQTPPLPLPPGGLPPVVTLPPPPGSPPGGPPPSCCTEMPPPSGPPPEAPPPEVPIPGAALLFLTGIGALVWKRMTS